MMVSFRDCVLTCAEDEGVVAAFNRLYEGRADVGALRRLGEIDSRLVDVHELSREEQELLACFMLFVHRQVWRKVEFAQRRLARRRGAKTGPIGRALTIAARGSDLHAP